MDPLTENRIRLALLDGQALFRESLARFLSAQPGLEVAGECATDEEALEILRDSKVDLLLLNFGCASQGVEGFIAAARGAGYQGRFLIVAENADARQSADAIKSGASGIFLKSEPPARLVQAIQLVMAGAGWLDQKIVRLLIEQLADGCPPTGERKPVSFLTDREQRVLLGILGGLTNRKIGDDLGISEGSVKALVQQLFLKAGVRKRSQLVRVALEGSLLTVMGTPPF
jgi:DNA-binding NarL/FixJ family response regulator